MLADPALPVVHEITFGTASGRLLVVLLLAAVLLVLTNGLSVVAPFVYALF
jgi:hypothetical protein